MLRGCQKRIIYMKDTGSSLFEEAYFILRSDKEYHTMCEDDMVREARRLISEGDYERRGGGGVMAFLLGALTSSVTIGVVAFILALL